MRVARDREHLAVTSRQLTKILEFQLVGGLYVSLPFRSLFLLLFGGHGVRCPFSTVFFIAGLFAHVSNLRRAPGALAPPNGGQIRGKSKLNLNVALWCQQNEPGCLIISPCKPRSYQSRR